MNAINAAFESPAEAELAEEGDVNFTFQARRYRDARRRAEGDLVLSADADFFVHQSLSTPCMDAIVASEGSYLIDASGRRLLDLHGNSVHIIGHRHPDVIAAVECQLRQLPFCPRRFANEPAATLAQRICEDILPCTPGGWRTLFAPAGSLAVSTALKLARLITGRHATLAMHGSFHGASLDAISAGGEEQFARHMGPLLPGRYLVEPWRRDDIDVSAALRAVDAAFDRAEADGTPIGAMIAEPIRWSTVTLPPLEYWLGVRHRCTERGALLVLDEIGTCLGRTGQWLACHHYDGIDADAIVLGKALGGGVMPLAATAVRADLATPAKTALISLGHYTHEKSPLAAAAALATIDVIERLDLLQRARSLGAELLVMLQDRLLRLPAVKSVRGLGMLAAIELDDPGLATNVLYDCQRRGLNFKVSASTVLTWVVPLTIERHELMWAVDQVAASLVVSSAEVDAGRSADDEPGGSPIA